MTQEEIDLKLSEALFNLTRAEQKRASVWWTFIRGMMYGLGFFVGSAILAAIVILILSKLQNWGNLGGFIDQIIQNTGKTKS